MGFIHCSSTVIASQLAMKIQCSRKTHLFTFVSTGQSVVNQVLYKILDTNFYSLKKELDFVVLEKHIYYQNEYKKPLL